MHLVKRYIYLINVSGLLVNVAFYSFIKTTSIHKSIQQKSNPWIEDQACNHFTAQVTKTSFLYFDEVLY
jgi:hypothetical protein